MGKSSPQMKAAGGDDDLHEALFVLELIESVTLDVLARIGNDREARYEFFRDFVELAQQSIQETVRIAMPAFRRRMLHSLRSRPEEAPMVTIKVRQNGPYVVDGEDVMLVDWNGAPYQVPKRPFALCRCGGSMTKPFCDGTHSKAGFQAAEAAVPGSQDRPAT